MGVDEVIVSMDPTYTRVTKMIEAAAYGPNGVLTQHPDICTLVVSSHMVLDKTNKNAKHLHQAFTQRCDETQIINPQIRETYMLNYNKSLIVLSNAEFGGIHIHQHCRGIDNEWPFMLSASKVSLHHFTQHFFRLIKKMM